MVARIPGKTSAVADRGLECLERHIRVATRPSPYLTLRFVPRLPSPYRRINPLPAAPLRRTFPSRSAPYPSAPTAQCAPIHPVPAPADPTIPVLTFKTGG